MRSEFHPVAPCSLETNSGKMIGFTIQRAQTSGYLKRAAEGIKLEARSWSLFKKLLQQLLQETMMA